MVDEVGFADVTGPEPRKLSHSPVRPLQVGPIEAVEVVSYSCFELSHFELTLPSCPTSYCTPEVKVPSTNPGMALH